MPRIRTVKPEFFQHEDLSSLDPTTHLFAVGLLCYADDYGYFNANPGLVKGMVFPLRGEAKNIGEMLIELQKIGYVQLGVGDDGKKYGRIVNFEKHQRVAHPTPSRISTLSITWEAFSNSPEKFVKVHENFVNPPETFRPEVERKGREVEGEEEPPPGLHPMSYAPKILQDIGLPETRGNSELVAAAIKARSRGEPSSYPAAVMYITARALDDKAQGIPINKFWFEDGKYEKSTGKKKSGLDFDCSPDV